MLKRWYGRRTGGEAETLKALPGRARCQRISSDTPAEELYVSVLVLGEIRQGIERIRMRDQAQARALEKWLQSLSPEFADRILPVDERVADQWGRLGLLQPVPTFDAFLAATALVQDLTVVSRDEDGFRRIGVRMINPFSKSKSVGGKAKAESGKQKSEDRAQRTEDGRQKAENRLNNKGAKLRRHRAGNLLSSSTALGSPPERDSIGAERTSRRPRARCRPPCC